MPCAAYSSMNRQKYRAEVARVLNHIILSRQAAGKNRVAFSEEFHFVLVDAVGASEEEIILAWVLRVEPAADHRIVLIDFHPGRRAPR